MHVGDEGASEGHEQKSEVAPGVPCQSSDLGEGNTDARVGLTLCKGRENGVASNLDRGEEVDPESACLFDMLVPDEISKGILWVELWDGAYQSYCEENHDSVL